MYSSASSIYTHFPWQRPKTWTRRVHENSLASSPHNLAGAHNVNLHTLTHVSHEVHPEAIQYAPPLSAYSADHCGLSVAYTEYNRALQMKALTGVTNAPVLPPQVLKRLDNLRRIRASGYSYLAPIGLNKTMRDLDEEVHLEEDEDDNPAIQAENLIAAGTSIGGETGNVSASSASNIANILSQVHVLPEADLDMQVPNADLDADDSEISLDESLSSSQSNTPDAFMAADVEYQEDHSLFRNSTLGHGSLSESHASVSTSLVLSSNIATNPTTAITTATALAMPTSDQRVCDDEDVDMTLE